MNITPDHCASNILSAPPPTEPRRGPSDTEVQAFIDLFCSLPGQQLYIKTDEGAKAVTADTQQAVRSHLLGEGLRYRKNYKGQPSKKYHEELSVHIGFSPIGNDNTVQVIGIDLDAKGGRHKSGLADAEAVRQQVVAKALALGLTIYWEVSGGGSGRHCWLFLESPLPASSARLLGLSLCPLDAPLSDGGVATPHTHRAIEVFPKQGERGLSGNQMLLPGWIGAQPGRLRLRDAITDEEILDYSAVERCDDDAIQAAIEAALEDDAKRQAAEEEAKIASRQKDQVAKKAAKKKSTGKPLQRTGETPSPALVHRQALAYLATMDGAISGQGGIKATGRAVCALVLGFGLSTYEALDLLLSDYNPRCQPSWDYDELLAKVQWADSLGGERGYRILPSISARLSAPVEILPEYSRRQVDSAKAGEAAAPKALLLRDTEVPLRRALIAAALPATAGPLMTVLKVSLGGGKSHQAREVILDLSRGLKDRECIVLCVPTHKLGLESYTALRALGADVIREFSAPTHPECSEKEFAAIEYLTGATGKDICLSCRRKDICPIAKGWEGANQNAPIVITTHASPTPKYAMRKHVALLVVDEEAPLVKGDVVTTYDLMALARNTSISDQQRPTLQAVASDLLAWWRKNGQGPSPLERRRNDLLYVAAQNPTRTPMAKVYPQGKLPGLGSPERVMHQRAAASAHKAGVWILDGAINGGEATLTKDGLVRHSQTPLARWMTARAVAGQQTIVLDATAGKTTLLHLTALTGCAPHKVEVAVADAIPVSRHWIVSGSTSRIKISDAANLSGACRRAAQILAEVPDRRKILLGTFKAAEDIIEQALRGEGPAQYIDAVQPLRDLQALGVQIDIIHYGAIRGLDCFKTYDAAIALGSYYQSDEDLQHRAKALGLPPLTRAELEAWREELASQELAQFFGRLRPTAAWGRSSLTMICIAKTLPEDWRPSQTQIIHDKGRPEAQASQGWAELLRIAVERAGSPKALEAALKHMHKPLSRRSIERYLAGASPAPPAEGAIKAYLTATVSSFSNISEKLERREEEGDTLVLTEVGVAQPKSNKGISSLSLLSPESGHESCSYLLNHFLSQQNGKSKTQSWGLADVVAQRDQRGGASPG